MERINWSAAIAVTLVAVFVLLIAISLLDTANWETNCAGMRSGSWSIWRGLFAPFMFLMPLAWLALPILGVTCMVRWLSSRMTVSPPTPHLTYT